MRSRLVDVLPGERLPVNAEVLVDTQRVTSDHLPELGALGCLKDLLVGSFGAAEFDVLGESAGEHDGVLGDIGDSCGDLCLLKCGE